MIAKSGVDTLHLLRQSNEPLASNLIDEVGANGDRSSNVGRGEDEVRLGGSGVKAQIDFGVVRGVNCSGILTMTSASSIISNGTVLNVLVDGVVTRKEVIGFDFLCFLDEGSLPEESDLFFMAALIKSKEGLIATKSRRDY